MSSKGLIYRIVGKPTLSIVSVLSVVILCLSGCGNGAAHRAGSVLTSHSFMLNVERQCGVVYARPSVKGEALGFVCGETASGAHFAATFTRRLHCMRFMTLVDVDDDRFQQCLSSSPRNPRGALLCESKRRIFAARTLPHAQSATVQLSTGQKITSRILVLNAADQEHWGGFFFDVLTSKIPARAVLIERGQTGRALGVLSLRPTPGCL